MIVDSGCSARKEGEKENTCIKSMKVVSCDSGFPDNE
jgi:hypothetical protein